MKKSDTFTEREKFEIIKPFIEKKKKLVSISQEKNIPYSTLKRWVSTYKKKGMEGLGKNIRKDKFTYRSVDKKTIEYIKKLYFENPDIKILDVHKEILDFLNKSDNDLEKSISYDTVYRIMNNLDPFIKNYSTNTLFQSKISNQVFEFRCEKLDIKIRDWISEEYKQPFLSVIYDNYSMAIASFYITFSFPNIDEILFLLRSAILADEENSCLVYGKPDELVINNIRIHDKVRLEEVKEKLNMEINFFSGTNNKLNIFYKTLNTVTLKNIELYEPSRLNYFDFRNVIRKYIEEIHNINKKEVWENNLERLEIIAKRNVLDLLLISVKSYRKIQNSGIKYQNLFYKHKSLRIYVGEIAEIKVNPFDIQSIKIYINDIFICDAVCPQLIDKKISLYEIKMLQTYIFMEYPNKVLTPAELNNKLVEILESNI